VIETLVRPKGRSSSAFILASRLICRHYGASPTDRGPYRNQTTWKSMKIRTITATWVHAPIPKAKQHRSDLGVADFFDGTIVRIETECGLVGWGEAKASVGSMGNNAAVATLINRELGPALIGEDPRDPRRLWEIGYNGARAHYALSRGRGFPVLGRRGIRICAIGAIDMACWDILGRSLDVPVWRLLGGKCRDTMPAYASGGWAPADKIGEQLESYIDRGGFRAVKMRVGAGDGDLMTSVRRVQAARAHLGDDIDIMVDAHGTYSVKEALRFARLVEDCNLAWFEEPVNADNKRGYGIVRAATDIPITGGESEFTRFDFRELIEHEAVDYFQPDLAIAGGITEGMRIAVLAETHEIKLALHLWGGALNFSAGLQVMAASPAAVIVEYSLGANPLLHDLAEESFDVIDGQVTIPERPGLGITINQDFLNAHAMD
jgi:L-alanine-DL-glutamate epimerase-like enolase superfamily enzyme